MPLRWTNSKDGKPRATVVVELRLRKDLYDWVVARTGWGQRKVVAWWKQEVLGNYGDRAVVLRKNGDVDVESWDELPRDMVRPDPNDPDLYDYSIVDWFDDGLYS